MQKNDQSKKSQEQTIIHQGAYVFIGISLFVCLFVGRIMQKLPNGFSQNSMERWHKGYGRNH